MVEQQACLFLGGGGVCVCVNSCSFPAVQCGLGPAQAPGPPPPPSGGRATANQAFLSGFHGEKKWLSERNGCRGNRWRGAEGSHPAKGLPPPPVPQQQCWWPARLSPSRLPREKMALGQGWAHFVPWLGCLPEGGGVDQLGTSDPPRTQKQT